MLNFFSITSKKKHNGYHDEFWDSDVERIQCELLYWEWGGRDLKTGERLTVFVNRRRISDGLPKLSGTELYEAALSEIRRHHFKILKFDGKSFPDYMKRDCRLQALVPLTQSSHSSIAKRGEARMWEERFAEAKQAVQEGKLFIPYWWKLEDRIVFANTCKSEGGSQFIIRI